MTKATTSTKVPPYVAFRTFLNFIEWLELGIPSRIDQSFWGQKLSWSYGNQLISALRFLGLITADDKPTEALERLVTRPDERKHLLHKILTTSYANISGLDLTRATYAQLEGRFHDLGVRAETLRKAIAFFVQAARYAELPLSNFIAGRVRAQKRQRNTRRGTSRAGQRRAQDNLDGRSPVTFQTGSGPGSDVSLHPALCGMLVDLQRQAPSWTSEEQRRWLAAFTGILEWAFPIRNGHDQPSVN